MPLRLALRARLRGTNRVGKLWTSRCQATTWVLDRPRLRWYDRNTGTPVQILTAADRSRPETFATALHRGDVVIQTLDDILHRYTQRPEHKSLAPDGNPADGETVGQLQRRPVRSTPADTCLTGKEGNNLTERLTGQTTEPADYRNDYGTRADPWQETWLPILTDMGAAPIIADTGLPPSTVYDTLKGTRPKRRTAAHLRAAAIAFARRQLSEWGHNPSPDPTALLVNYVTERDRRGKSIRRCQWCGEPLTAGARADAKYDTQKCRRAAQRARTS